MESMGEILEIACASWLGRSGVIERGGRRNECIYYHIIIVI